LTMAFPAIFSRNSDANSQNPEREPLVNPEPEAQMAHGELRSEVRKGDVAAEWVAFFSISVFLISAWLITFNSGAARPFVFHPLLQSLGISFFTYGIITLQPTSQPQTKAAGLTRHQCAMISGFVSILLGASAIFYNKARYSASHFTTWHGKFGLLSVVWLFIQLLFGASSVWFNGALLGGGAKAKALWKFHRLSGYILFPLLLTTAHLGGEWSSWSTLNSEGYIRIIAFTVAPLLVLGAVLVRIRTSKMKFF